MLPNVKLVLSSSLDFCWSRKGWLDVFRLIQGSFLHRKTRKVIKRIVKFNFSSGKIKCVFEGVKLIIFLIKDEKNEKVVRVPKNHCIFLSIKTFDRCQKEKTERKSPYAMAREERRTPRSLRRCAREGGGGGIPYILITLSPFMQAALWAIITLAIFKLWGSLLNTMNSLKFNALTSDLKGSKYCKLSLLIPLPPLISCPSYRPIYL